MKCPSCGYTDENVKLPVSGVVNTEYVEKATNKVIVVNSTKEELKNEKGEVWAVRKDKFTPPPPKK